jgi:hypothetical protein
MLHLQTSNQSPIAIQFGISPLAEAAVVVSVVVVVVAVAAAISYQFNNASAILALNV